LNHNQALLYLYCNVHTLGGSLLAAALAQERGLACSTAGGTHHAHPEFGSGFCLLNDLAIVARQLTLNKSANRVLIVDLDVHQVGNIIMSFDDEVMFVCNNDF
jgi:acetoin utilization deacetylase AcuC-like enzyme